MRLTAPTTLFVQIIWGGGKIQMPYIQRQQEASTWIDLTLSKEEQASLHYRDSKIEGKRDS